MFETAEVENRPGDGEFSARFDLVLEAAQLLVEVRRRGIHGDADVERRRRTDRLTADIAAAIEPRDEIGESDRVDVKHHRRVGIVANAGGIAGHEHEVAQPHGVRAEQIGLDAEQIAVAAGIMKDGLDAGLLLDEYRE